MTDERSADPHRREAKRLPVLQPRLHPDRHVQAAHLQGARNRGSERHGNEAVHREHCHQRRVRSESRQCQALKGKETKVPHFIKYKQASRGRLCSSH